MNRKVVGILMVLVAMGAMASAATVACPTGGTQTLSTLISEGADGCSIGDKIFYNFNYLGGGTNPPAATSISMIFNNTDPLDPFFTASGFPNLIGTAGYDAQITYDVKTANGQPLINGTDLSLTGPTTMNGGSVTLTESVCAGGATPVGVVTQGACTAAGGTWLPNFIAVVQPSANTENAALFPNGGAYSSISVLKDLNLSGTEADSVASISSLTDSVHQVVPEPVTLSMMGLGLLGLGLMRRRQVKK